MVHAVASACPDMGPRCLWSVCRLPKLVANRKHTLQSYHGKALEIHYISHPAPAALKLLAVHVQTAECHHVSGELAIEMPRMLALDEAMGLECVLYFWVCVQCC